MKLPRHGGLPAERHMPSTVSVVQGNHHRRGEGLHWSDRANLQAVLLYAPAFQEGQQIPSQHVRAEARLGHERSTKRLKHPVECAAEIQRLPKHYHGQRV